MDGWKLDSGEWRLAGDQRKLMGYVSGWMYIAVGLFGLLGLAVPQLRFHPIWQLCLGLASVLYGAITLRDLVDWGRRPLAVHYAAMFAALPVIAVGIWCTGAVHSYIRPMLLLAPVHWGFFVPRRDVLVGLCGGLVLTLWAPALYAAGTISESTVATGLAFSVTIVCLAGALSLIRTRLAAAEAKLRALTTSDPLTGLLNRRGFAEELGPLIAQTPDGSAPFMVLLDLDNLKPLNDTYGHAAGDEALRTFAARLSAATCEHALIARIGGDEFAVAHRAADACAVQRIASGLELSVAGELIEPPGVQISATSGWSLAPSAEVDAGAAAEQLFAQADERLLARKQERGETSPGAPPRWRRASLAASPRQQPEQAARERA